MMQRTDRHFRVMMRVITRHTLLYTEMIVARAILHGDRDHLLGYDPVEHPLALQLGGNDPHELSEAARIAWDRGYDEINLNVGCPSDRVQGGFFGACLMARPETVARAVEAMRSAVPIPVTVKHRIGIDDLDSYEHMLNFVDVVAAAGSDRFTVHARKAWLQGLSPRENREIPPLRHHLIHRLKAERPTLCIETNGGILTLDQVEEHLRHVDAVMVGRAAYDTPLAFAEADARVFGAPPRPRPTPGEVVRAMFPYIERQLARGVRLHHVTKHMLTLFRGVPGTRRWKRHISENPNGDLGVVTEALARAEGVARAGLG